MSEIVFLRDTIMPREVFEQLPECITSAGRDVAQMARAHNGKVCRALLARDDGAPAWHAVAWNYFNGTERALASRIIFAKYQPEE